MIALNPAPPAPSQTASSPTAGFLPDFNQVANLAFGQSPSTAFTSVARISDVNLAPFATRLTLNLSLKAGQKYSFNLHYPSGGPAVSLVDAKGKKTAVKMVNGFSVGKSGNYQLVFSSSQPLKSGASLDSVEINSKALLPTKSGDTRIDALLAGGTNQWWHDVNSSPVKGTQQISPKAKALASGSSVTELTYNFLSSAPSGQNMTEFREMTDAQKEAVRRAFDYYSKIINVSFREVTGNGTGNINLGSNQQTGSAGYANPPNASGVKDKAFLFLAHNAATNSAPGMQEGGYGYMTVLHEIGHTLGLKHPGNYNAGGGGTPGPYLPTAEDSHQFSMMSYNASNSTRGANPSSAMLYDVAALQYLYGTKANSSTATDGVFNFSPDEKAVRTLWSNTVTDRIDLTNLRNGSDVDLNAGAFSNINKTAGAESTVHSGNKNVALAYGSKVNSVTLSNANGVTETVTLNNAFKSGSFNSINRFDALDDKIVLKTSLFKKLSAANISFSETATTKNTKIIVNRTTGEIFYDADGNGKGIAKKIAQYTAVAGRGEVSAANFTFKA
ncbi:MAG: M12 family metallo-peptidase [Candidatus Didemnitutus sp.]|nr:M12 family metallo-peptidase [Candidatus Didemnitutus sp.]